MIDYTPLLDTLKSTPLAGWHTTLAEGLQARLAELQHGDLERWQQSLRNLPPLDGVQHDFSRGVKLTGAAALPAYADSDNPVEFDAELAAELGADDYGMKRYVMAFLKSGPNRPEDPEEAQALQRAHLDNIRRMAEDGKLVLAGPFMDRGEIRGIYVFAVDSVEEAEALTATDPAVQAGSLVMELHPWYGSAALMKVNDIHSAIAKSSP